MSNEGNFRGIAYAVSPVGARRWQWSITPPTAVRGLEPVSGEIEGDHKHAVLAAKKAILGQTKSFNARELPYMATD